MNHNRNRNHHQHHDDDDEVEVTLPLRLAAEPYAKRDLSSSSVALSTPTSLSNIATNSTTSSSSSSSSPRREPELAILMDDRGILGLACERKINRSELLSLRGIPSDVKPYLLQQHQKELWILIRDSPTTNTCQWYVLLESQEEPSKQQPPSQQQQQQQPNQYSIIHNTPVARWITTSIRNYYAQQILEPSVRGFLSVLEKQFSQSNLYIFELLQNAVDDGATNVSFRIITDNNNNNNRRRGYNNKNNNNNNNSSSSFTSLQMTHNGRRFTPLDVLGLSSVGLSTKSRQGKRTIGFMGVGFKAVYKRYAKVTIDDGRYAFTYSEPSSSSLSSSSSSNNNNNDHNNNHKSGGYGWVMLPRWQTPQHGITNDNAGNNNGNNEDATTTQSSGCHFSLQQPRGGLEAIHKDLAVLPKTAPPLLGRAALLKRQHDGDTTMTDGSNSSSLSWTLDWNGTIHEIQRTELQYYTPHDMSEIVTVKITNPSSSGTSHIKRWLFVTHEYTPSVEAANSYHQHTKRSHAGKEQICGFIPLKQKTTMTGSDEDELTTNFAGVVHSVLPTKIKLPLPIHLQGSFLLSVDRQQVQDLSDNAWNMDILLKLPNVLAIVFRWAARVKLTNYTALAKLLPIPSSTTTVTATDSETSQTGRRKRSNTATAAMTTTTTTAFATVLNQSISLRPLQDTLQNELTLPVAMPPMNTGETNDMMDVDKNTTDTDGEITTTTTITTSIATDYYEGSKSIWVPPAFHKLLSPDFLRGWLGKRPIRTDIFGQGKEDGGTENNVPCGAYHPLFRQITHILDPLPNRTRQLGHELQLHQKGGTTFVIEMLLRMMAGIGLAYEEHPAAGATNTDSALSTNNNNNNNKHGNNNNNKQKGQTPDYSTAKTTPTSNAVEGPKLPSSTKDWPVFLDETGALRTVDQIVLPDQDMAAVPSDLMLLLRPYFLVADETTKPQSKGKKTKPTIQKKTLPRLHPKLEQAICDIENNKIPDDLASDLPWDSITLGAASFLKRVRAENPKQVISVATAVEYLLKSLSSGQDGTRSSSQLSPDDVATIVKIAQYALETGNQSLFSFVLVDSAETGIKKLVPASQAYIGKMFDETGPGGDLDSFAGSRLEFISSAYSDIVTSLLKKRKFIQLLSSAGVQTGLVVTISAIVDVDREKSLLVSEVLPKLPGNKLPQTRNKNTKNEILLPYGLDVVMNRRKHSLLDSELASEWEQLVETMSVDCAKGFIGLLLAIPMEDATTHLTGKTIVAAAKCFTGMGNATSGTAITQQPVRDNKCSARISGDTSVPLRRRLYFLPPGQAGAKALDISEVRLITQLKKLKWLPCSVPSDPTSNLVLLRPEEAILEADSSRPEMPVVQLPPVLKRRLQTSILAKALTFGTRAPPPPVAELRSLANEAKRLLSANKIDLERVSALSTRMVSVWSSIGRAYLRDDGLSNSDLKALRALCDTACCMPVKRTLECIGDLKWIVPVSRCVRLVETTSGRRNNEREELKESTVASLVASNFLCDFHHSAHNPFFLQPDVSMAIQNLARVPDLQNMQSSTLVSACGSFIRFCYSSEPVISSRLSPLRAAFSYAMKWCMESPKELPQSSDGIKVWVRSGPGMGSKALRRRWVSLYSGDIQPVLDDSRVRSALLTPEMGIQLLGVLDHTENEDCHNARLLARIDKEIIQFHGIWRLSDRRFTVKTKARGSGKLIEGASSRLQLVCALLKSIENQRNHFSETGETSVPKVENNFLEISVEPPPIIRHESLSREFKGPGMEEPSLIPLFAVFGKAPKITEARCILVSGDPDDYSMELEEVILSYVGVYTGSGSSQSKPRRAALRLLSHLENERSFLKFVKRDFDDFDVTDTWRKLCRRRAALADLKKAEKDKDIKALKEALMVAEEVCEDDSDGGDNVLQSARDIFNKLEQEAKAKVSEEQSRVREELEEAIRSGDKSTLLMSLESAEKICDGDDSDNDILDRARQSLQRFETERGESMEAINLKTGSEPGVQTLLIQEPGMGRGRGRGRTLPAWMTSSDVPQSVAPGQMTKDAATGLAEGPELDPMDTEKPSIEEVTDLPGGGRGRGRTIPAWMTSADGPKPPASQDHEGLNEGQSMEEGVGNGPLVSLNDAATSNAFSSSVAEAHPDTMTEGTNGTGRGRGRTLPAWMTSSGGPKPALVAGDQVRLSGAQCCEGSMEPDPPSAQEEARNILSSILHDDGLTGVPTLDKPPNGFTSGGDLAAAIALGRGRGVSRTLPAWMTSDAATANTGLKRGRSTDSDDAEGAGIKKSRTEGGVAFEYSIKVTMDPEKEPDFVNWLQPALQEAAKAREGTATLTRSQFED